MTRADPQPACHGHDPELWFPEQGEAAKTAYAQAICARCPLHDPCRDFALTQPPDRLYGIWGGLTHSYRRRNRRKDPT